MWLSAEDKHIQDYCGIHFNTEPIKCLGIYIRGDEKLREDLNWVKKLRNFDNLLERWKERKLTIFGKVVVLKALAISQLVFNISVLPVSNDIIKKINRSLFKFIWNSNDRIRRNVLINNKDNGGIDMIDIECKVKALKAAWVSRIFLNDECKWVSFLKEFLHRINFRLEHMTKMQFVDVKAFPVIKSLPKFYQDIVICFNNIKATKCKNGQTSTFLSKMIWGNDEFTHKSKCLYLKNWINSGFIFVKDLFDKDGNFLTGKTICERLHCTQNWMSEYLLVKTCIMVRARNFDCTHSTYINTHKLYQNLYMNYGNKQYDIRELNSKFYYKILIEKKCGRNYTEKCWQKKFSVEIFQSEWKDIYKSKVWKFPVKNIAEFNYKMLHKLVYGKYEISKWKKDVSPLCSYCNKIDSIEHMLFECSIVQTIWQRLGLLLKVNLKWKHVVLGFFIDGEVRTFRYVIISIVAYGIFKTKIIYEQKELQGNMPYDVMTEVIKTVNTLQMLKDRGLNGIKHRLKEVAREL